MTNLSFSPRKPQAISAARLAAFNETSVESFFNIYNQILTERSMNHTRFSTLIRQIVQLCFLNNTACYFLRDSPGNKNSKPHG